MARKRGTLRLTAPHARKRKSRAKQPVAPAVEETWSVEDILDDKAVVSGRNKTHEFLIKWRDCPPEQNSWEPLDNLLAGEWNPKEEVIDYLEAKYKGGMVLLEELPGKGSKGKIKYSIVTREKQREMQRKGTLDKELKESVKEISSKKSATKRAASSSSERLREQHRVELGLRADPKPRSNLLPESIVKRPTTAARRTSRVPITAPSAAESRKRKPDTTDDESSASDTSSVQILGSVSSSSSVQIIDDSSGELSEPSRKRRSMPVRAAVQRPSSPEILRGDQRKKPPPPSAGSKADKWTAEDEATLRDDLFLSDDESDADSESDSDASEPEASQTDAAVIAGPGPYKIIDHEEPVTGGGRASPSTWMYTVLLWPAGCKVPPKVPPARHTYAWCEQEYPLALQAYLQSVLRCEEQRRQRMLKEKQQKRARRVREEAEEIVKFAALEGGYELLLEFMEKGQTPGAVTLDDFPAFHRKVDAVMRQNQQGAAGSSKTNA
ncbi:DNA ligase 1-like [Paramacrobiotus metropolitanus]|uniref:DNA ligase 1-like n=1 Tax=Paramacrobiotus metropolitanus TaxID=2943436 RepID=UPI0024459204|nr:DNA ligase 1-like [Paramacrobiotus metropolitanus]